MDHKFHTEPRIAARYLMGQLSAAERSRFEEHYLDCKICLDRLEAAEAYQLELQNAAQSSDGQPPARLTARLFNLRWPTIALAGAFAILLALPLLFYFTQTRRLRHELEQARAVAIKPSAPTPAAPEQQPSAENQLQAALAAQMSKMTQPQVNTPIYDLSVATRAAETQPGSINEIILPGSPGWLVLSLGLEGPPEYKTYRATLETGGRIIWRQNGLQPNLDDSLTINFHSSFFQPGDYLIVLEGGASASRPVTVANYPFRISRKNPKNKLR